MSFLIVFLLYACYQPLRFSIEDPERQARYAAVFAVVAGAFVPLNFMAVRMAESLVHPRVLSTTGGSMPGSMRLTFLVSLIGMALLFVTLWKYELASKQRHVPAARAQAQAGRRRRGLGPQPAPLRGAARSDAGAARSTRPASTSPPRIWSSSRWSSIYVAIMAGRLSRIEKDLGEVTELLERRAAEDDREPVAR